MGDNAVKTKPVQHKALAFDTLGKTEGVTLFASSRYVFARVPGDRFVYCLGRPRSVNLALAWGSNDEDRRMFATALGIPFKELRRELRAIREREKESDLKREEERFKHMAKRLGYKVTKEKAK